MIEMNDMVVEIRNEMQLLTAAGMVRTDSDVKAEQYRIYKTK